MPSFSFLAAVALGGALGSLSRYLSGMLFAFYMGTAWPYGTFFVNSAGSFLIGLAAALLHGTHPLAASFLIAGFLGGFTTFSSFMNESLSFFLNGRFLEGAAYILIMTASGLLLAFLGWKTAGMF